MKRKLLAVALIGTMCLTGCGSSTSTESTAESTTAQETISSEDVTEVQQQKPINITSVDSTILYQYFENSSDKFNKDDIMAKFENDVYEGNLLPISNAEEIKVDFGSDAPKKVTVEKTYLDKEDKTKNKKEDLKLDANSVVNIKPDFESKDVKACLYEIVAEYDGLYVCYAFGVTNSEYVDDSKNLVGFLSETDQKTYDEFKTKLIETGEKTVLKDLQPIVIAEFLTQALMEKEYGVAYALYATDENTPTEYDFSNSIKKLSKTKKLEYIDGLKKVKEGKFVEEEKDKKGYIEYQPTPDHPMALDFVKNDGIWQIVYMPITE